MVMIMGLVLIWPFYQLYDTFHSRAGKQDVVYLLYQVSLFQMELLNSVIGDGTNYRDTNQLNVLKQAAYAANYSHEHLVIAVEPDSLAELQSIPQLMQYILRLQIGGNRLLKPDEVTT